MENYIVHKKVAIKAPPEKVWDALTNPSKTKKYFFNCEVYSNWKPGSSIKFVGKMFLVLKVEMKGVIDKIERNKLLQYTLKNKSDKSETTSQVTDELYYANGRTILSVTDNVGQGKGAEKRFKRSEKGWDKILKGLKEFVENDYKEIQMHSL